MKTFSLSSFFAFVSGIRITKVFGETVIWNTTQDMTGYVLFEFQGWTNHERERLYHHDVNYLFNAAPREIERQKDPSFEDWPHGIIWIDSVGGMKRENPEQGIVVGTGIRVVFQPRRISIDEVGAYLERCGIRVMRRGEVVVLPKIKP